MTTIPPLAVVTHRVHRQVIDLLTPACRVIANDTAESWTSNTLREQAREAEALMVFMPDSVDDDFLAQCLKLKIIAAALKGYDNFDVAACTRRGIWFSIVPDLLSLPTAELALGLILGITRNVAAGDRRIRNEGFAGWRPVLYGSGMVGRVVGILGMGKLGRTLAGMLAGLGTRIVYSDKIRLSGEEEQRMGVTFLPFEQTLATCDIAVVLLPLDASTVHLVDASALGRMKRGSYLVNVGRGSVVDEKAVADALDSGQLAGYAADVFEMEDWARMDRPRSIEPRLLRYADRTLFTPHLGSAVADVRLQIEMAAANNILQALRGEHPADAVNRIE